MSEDKCKAQYDREAQIFREMVYTDGEQAYTQLVSKLKEIRLNFVDDPDGTDIPTVVKSITKKTGQHFKENISV